MIPCDPPDSYQLQMLLIAMETALYTVGALVLLGVVFYGVMLVEQLHGVIHLASGHRRGLRWLVGRPVVR